VTGRSSTRRSDFNHHQSRLGLGCPSFRCASTKIPGPMVRGSDARAARKARFRATQRNGHRGFSSALPEDQPVERPAGLPSGAAVCRLSLCSLGSARAASNSGSAGISAANRFWSRACCGRRRGNRRNPKQSQAQTAGRALSISLAWPARSHRSWATAGNGRYLGAKEESLSPGLVGRSDPAVYGSGSGRSGCFPSKDLGEMIARSSDFAVFGTAVVEEKR
jgi:hypothetical protein